MKKLILYKDGERAAYHATFKNNHGRKLYLHVVVAQGHCLIDGCFYIDRTKRPSPKNLITQTCMLTDLPRVLATELDTLVGGIELCEDPASKEELISGYLKSRKPKILILHSKGGILKTVFKNKFRRVIYLGIALEGSIATISECYYVDPRGKDLKISPQGLITVRFEFSLHRLLEVVNCELEGGFTDAVICEQSTVALGTTPICGSI